MISAILLATLAQFPLVYATPVYSTPMMSYSAAPMMTYSAAPMMTYAAAPMMTYSAAPVFSAPVYATPTFAGVAIPAGGRTVIKHQGYGHRSKMIFRGY